MVPKRGIEDDAPYGPKVKTRPMAIAIGREGMQFIHHATTVDNTKVKPQEAIISF